jgi:hypothetical protein
MRLGAIESRDATSLVGGTERALAVGCMPKVWRR